MIIFMGQRDDVNKLHITPVFNLVFGRDSLLTMLEFSLAKSF